jgi:hypothetical protein
MEEGWLVDSCHGFFVYFVYENEKIIIMTQPNSFITILFNLILQSLLNMLFNSYFDCPLGYFCHSLVCQKVLKQNLKNSIFKTHLRL